MFLYMDMTESYSICCSQLLDKTGSDNNSGVMTVNKTKIQTEIGSISLYIRYHQVNEKAN